MGRREGSGRRKGNGRKEWWEKGREREKQGVVGRGPLGKSCSSMAVIFCICTVLRNTSWYPMVFKLDLEKFISVVGERLMLLNF